MSPKISIIVPIYNDERNLYKCIDSLLNQSFKDYEIILVDDGSTDASVNICNQYGIDVYRINHQGSGAARNEGIRHSKGEYIAFVDSDDYIDYRYLEILYNEVVQNNSDLCICDYLTTNEYKPNIFNKQIEKRLLTKDECFRMYFRVNQKKDYYGVWGKLIKKELLVNTRFIEGKINEDIPFIYEIINKANKIMYVNETLYYYYNNPKGVTSRKFDKEKLDLLYMWDIVYGKVKEEHPSYMEICKQCIMRARFTLLAKMFIDGYDTKNDELNNIHHDLKQYVRKHYFDLLKINMSLKRKILLTFLII